jgi:hypothetical protein
MNLNSENDLDKALRSLKNQGISVNEEHIPPDGRVFFLEPTGIVLTARQILKLRADRELDSQGIKNFERKEKELVVEDVESARRRVPPEQLRSWTAAEVCDYINQEFDRIHSVKQVTAVLNRLNVEYKKV